MREDASFAAAYLTSLALGVLIVSLRGSAVDLMNILFGAILAVDDTGADPRGLGTTTLTLVGLAAIYRPLVVECFNPGFLAAMGVRGSLYHYLFLALAVLNMVAAFQALGTLMALGLMLLPAVAASFWAREVWSMTPDRRAHGVRVGRDRPAGLVPCRPAVGAGDRAVRQPVLPGLAAAGLARLGAHAAVACRFTCAA